jgi:hypothetical protein
VLRPGSAGANNAENHIRVFHTAVAQLPEGFYDETGTLARDRVLVRTDSARASRIFLWHLHSRGVQFSTSYTLLFGRAHMTDWITDVLDAIIDDRTTSLVESNRCAGIAGADAYDASFGAGRADRLDGLRVFVPGEGPGHPARIFCRWIGRPMNLDRPRSAICGCRMRRCPWGKGRRASGGAGDDKRVRQTHSGQDAADPHEL